MSFYGTTGLQLSTSHRRLLTQLLRCREHQTIHRSPLCYVSTHIFACFYMRVDAVWVSQSCTCTCAGKKSPDLSVWVAERTTLVVGLTRVKPGLFETGLTLGLSYVLCVWELLTFRPFPHVRCAEAPKAAGWPVKPETVSLRLQMEEVSFALKFLMWKSFQLLLMNHLLHRVNVSIQ